MFGLKLSRVGFALAVGAGALLMWCSAGLAQVLDQVPSEAIVVFHVNSLQTVNQKASKLAHDWGLDELQPELKDPLNALMEKGQVTKGVNKSGELAVAVLSDANNQPSPVVLVPVSDYDAFLDNFEKVGAAQNGVQELKHKDNGQTVFAIHRGSYAAMGQAKDAIAENPGGIKLQGTLQREVREKDITMLVNMPIVRQKYLGEFQKNRQKFIDDCVKAFAAQAQLKGFEQVANTCATAIADMTEQFMKDSEGLVVSGNIDATGILFSGVAQFTSGSQWGKNIAQLKNSDQPLLAGLPDRKYFGFGGVAWDRARASQLLGQILNPVRKDLAGANEQGKQISTALDAVVALIGATDRMAIGYAVPEGGGFVQTVQILTGDAKTIEQSQKQVMDLSNTLVNGGPAGAMGMKIKSTGQKNVDGVTVDTYETSVNPDPNNPQAMQAKMIMQLVYGGPTITTSTGIVNDHTFVVVQGGDDAFLKEAITNARAGRDALSSSRIVAAVSGQLPQKRFCEEYVALDNIISAGLRVAQNYGVPVKIKVPADLPPIGMTASSDGSALRGDFYIPSETVQSLIAAGIQAYQQFQKGPNGNL